MEHTHVIGVAGLSAEKIELLAYLLEEENLIVEQTIPPRRDLPSPPLSFAQQRLWFLDQLEPGTPLYNMAFAYRLSGPLQIMALEQSLNAIVQRHEALRTTFTTTDGEPFQVITGNASIPLQQVDLQAVPEAEKAAQVLQLCTAEAQRSFDLSSGPLCRAMVVQVAAEEYVFQFTMHHIVSDGWSLEVFFRELSALYRAHCTGASSPLPALPIQYADYAVWQRQWLQGDILAQQLTYWKQQLAGSPPVLELPMDRPRPAVQTFQGARHPMVLPTSLSAALKALSQQEGVTLFMTLLSTLQALLHRYSGHDDILVGTPIANRHWPELEGLIGFFVNTLVLRTAVSGTLTFRELLGRVREVTLGAYAHQDLPFEKLVEELQPTRHLGHTPLFQVMFAWQNVPEVSLELPGLTVHRLPIQCDTAKFDLTLLMRQAEGTLQGAWEYNTALFDETTIARLTGHFQTMLEGVVTDPNQTIATLPLLTPAEQQQLLITWNNTQTEYPAEACLHELFEAQVQRTPNAVAVVYEGTQLTYEALNQRANQLAHYLRVQGVGPETRIGIVLERSLDLLVGLLGILKAGGAYVPIDPAYPPERQAFMLEDAQIPLVLTQQRFLAALLAQRAQVVCLDTDWTTLAQPEDQDNPCSGTTVDNLAYVIYTSGSTGHPKGVMISHSAVHNHLLGTQIAFPLTATDGVLQTTSVSFDPSVWEFFAPLVVGARVVLPRPGGQQDATYLLSLISQAQVTVLHTVPALVRLLLEAEVVAPCSGLRYVFCGGEALTGELQDRFYARFEGAILWNLYGPTEATVAATAWRCEHSSPHQTIPIGRPLANTQVYLLDAQRQPVPMGLPGELYIGGACLARGYLHRPALTAEKFIPHPFSVGARLYKTGDLVRYRADGNLEFLGRKDQQVKVRGFRIELGEIEAVLAQHSDVREAVVVAREDDTGDKYLAAYLLATSQALPDRNALHTFLQAKLPDYMIPAVFVTLETLPLTPNGKLDYRALPVPERTGVTPAQRFVAPRNRLEYQLAQVWTRGFGRQPIGVQDNFFALGGHSLLAVRLCAQMGKSLGTHIPLASLYQAPTIECLARLLYESNWVAPQSLLLPYRAGGTKPPFFCIHGVELMGYAMSAEQPYYALHPHALDGRRPPDSVAAMAADYIKDIQTLQPGGPYFLAGVSIGGMIAFEMAHQLHQQGQEVALLILIDPTRPQPHLVCEGARQSLHTVGRKLIRMICELYLRAGRRVPPCLRMQYFLDVSLKAGRAYVPQVYPGRVLFFRAEQSPDNLQVEWHKLVAGAWESHVIPGDHSALFQEPHGRILAEYLASALHKELS